MVHRVISAWMLRSCPAHIRAPSSRIAKTMDEISSGLDSDIVRRSDEVRLIEQDHFKPTNTLRYEVTSGGPTYTVTIRVPDEDATGKYEESDVLVSCSCPHFRWGGCEHHAEKGDYLYQPEWARGDLSKPTVRDPEGDNYICKHIYKAFDEASSIYLD